ncbi:MAG: AAA family ATPase, partial [Pseudomonadota bacterium]
MEFQKLRLTGFKSFVEPTDFDILPGLTGIVGPNGCGKSNLLEALRWVMGATSAKALRAGGMEDVIFAGTGTPDRQGRPGRSWAEVSLHLNNEDRTAPAQYNDHPTLEITRRITKKTEGASSSYRINGKDVRAKDVQLLFADAATGANSPALVRQGQVSDLINAKPENRRRFLEEAAGVTGLNVRRHEAELRLKAASTNLERLEDVTGELEQQRSVLSRQARHASRYRNIAGHLKRAEALLAYARWTDAKDTADQSADALKASLVELEEAAKLAASAHTTREKAHEQIEPLRQKEAEAAAALHRLEVEQENFEKELDRAKAEIERLQGERERLERELAREKDLNADAAAALESLLAEEEQIRQREASEASRLEEADHEVDMAQAALDEAEGKLEQAQRAFAEARANRSAAEGALGRMDRVVMAAREEIVRVRDQLAQFEAEADSTGHITQLTTDQDTANAEAQAASDRLAALDRERQAAEAQLEAAQGPRDETRAAVNAIQAEIDTLTRVLAASEPEGRSVLEDIAVTEGYEGALAAALGEDLEASDDAQADRHWSALGAEPLSTSLNGVTPLSQFVTGAPVLNRRLQSVGVISAEDGPRLAATLSAGQILVSREGDVWRWDGFIARAGAKTAAAA